MSLQPFSIRGARSLGRGRAGKTTGRGLWTQARTRPPRRVPPAPASARRARPANQRARLVPALTPTLQAFSLLWFVLIPSDLRLSLSPIHLLCLLISPPVTPVSQLAIPSTTPCAYPPLPIMREIVSFGRNSARPGWTVDALNPPLYPTSLLHLSDVNIRCFAQCSADLALLRMNRFISRPANA